MFYGRHKSVDGNTVSHFFANKKMLAVSYPLISKKYAGEALKLFISQYNAPEFLTFDGAAEQCKRGTLFMKQASLHTLKHNIYEHFRPNQNAVEGVIREIRHKSIVSC